MEIAKFVMSLRPKHIKLIPIVAIILLAVRTITRIKHIKSVKAKYTRIENICSQIPSEETIFVSIPSYRDPECIETVIDCFNKAACPYRIYIGVCEQNAGNDINIMEEYTRRIRQNNIPDYKSNLRVYSIDAQEAQGPTLARAIIEKQLYKGEKYVLMIDAHMLFTQDWDLGFTNDIKKTQDKAIITMYPGNYDSRHLYIPGPPSSLEIDHIDPLSGFPEMKSKMMNEIQEYPTPSIGWASCCSFMPGSALVECPYDVLPFVFTGEQGYMHKKYTSRGYAMFHPTKMHVLTKWRRPLHTFWGNMTENEYDVRNKTYNKMKRL